MNVRLRLGIVSIVVLVLMLGLLGCGSSSSMKNESMPTRSAEQMKAVVPPSSASGASPKNAAVEKKMIESATVALETSKVEDVEKRVLALIEERQGNVDNINVSLSSNGLRHGAYTLRIPQGKLREVVDAISGLPDCVVRQKNISAQDVTEEYIDVNARIENMQRQEIRLREILNKANTVDEIMKVENELTRVRTQLEATQARLKALTNRIEMATIYLTIREVNLTAAPGFGGKLVSALNEGFDMAGHMLLSTITFGIGLLPLAALIYLLWLGLRKLKTMREAKKVTRQDQANPPASL